MERTPHTTAGGLASAKKVLSGDWDEHGTDSIHLPSDVAPALLKARGWTRGSDGGWICHATGDKFWYTEEALQFALLAEVAS